MFLLSFTPPFRLYPPKRRACGVTCKLSGRIPQMWPVVWPSCIPRVNETTPLSRVSSIHRTTADPRLIHSLITANPSELITVAVTPLRVTDRSPPRASFLPVVPANFQPPFHSYLYPATFRSLLLQLLSPPPLSTLHTWLLLAHVFYLIGWCPRTFNTPIRRYFIQIV